MGLSFNIAKNTATYTAAKIIIIKIIIPPFILSWLDYNIEYLKMNKFWSKGVRDEKNNFDDNIGYNSSFGRN